MNGVPASLVPDVVASAWRPTIVASAQLWTPANVLVYSAPLEYRLLVSNIFDLAWNTINSDISAGCGVVEDECDVRNAAPRVARSR